jgi:competence protein ComEC
LPFFGLHTFAKLPHCIADDGGPSGHRSIENAIALGRLRASGAGHLLGGGQAAARGFAVRGADGRLALHHSGGDSFAVREWLAADADGRDVHDRGLGQGIACDQSGCIGKLADGALVAYVLAPDAYEEDCRRAALVVATRGDPPADCRAKVIPRELWRQRGALALRRQQGANGVDFAIDSARPKNFDRPWSPAAARRQTPPATIATAPSAEGRV